MKKDFIKTYEDYLESGTIKTIDILEKKDIIEFLSQTYQDNLQASLFNLEKFPRWSIISGYYAMHDISKLYLAIKYELKFTKPSVHDALIKALKKLISKKDILDLIDKGNEEFIKIQRLDYFLAKGKYHREKTQYYTSKSYLKLEVVEIAKHFLEQIVKPYIKIIEEMITLEK